MYLNENYNPYSESAESETPVQNGAKVKKQVNNLFTCQTVDKAPSCEGAFLVS